MLSACLGLHLAPGAWGYLCTAPELHFLQLLGSFSENWANKTSKMNSLSVEDLWAEGWCWTRTAQSSCWQQVNVVIVQLRNSAPKLETTCSTRTPRNQILSEYSDFGSFSSKICFKNRGEVQKEGGWEREKTILFSSHFTVNQIGNFFLFNWDIWEFSKRNKEVKWLQILMDFGPVFGDTKSLSQLLLGFVWCEI